MFFFVVLFLFLDFVRFVVLVLVRCFDLVPWRFVRYEVVCWLLMFS